MAQIYNRVTAINKAYSLFIIFLFSSIALPAQKNKADSLKQLLSIEKIDSNKVKLMWQLADIVNFYNTDTALLLSQQALYLAKNINYLEGQSRALGVLSNTLRRIGNYPRALEFNIEKLQLEEKGNNPRNLASVLMNIGLVYSSQQEYQKALDYCIQSDSVITRYNIEYLKHYSYLNLGDIYFHLNIFDSAYQCFNKALQIARNLNDDNFIGASQIGIANVYQKTEKYQESKNSYKAGIEYLQKVNDNENLCEAMLGLANLYKQISGYDSAAYFANASLSIAQKSGFLSKELDAAQFLSEHYKSAKNIDSAFVYINYVYTLNDSLNSKSRIRESQIISSNEQFRQIELEEARKLAKKERNQQLQLLFIGILIPGLFLLTLLLSRVKIHIRVIRTLGVVSLLFFFEYLTLWLHPTVAALTHHTPVWEILIFVAIGSILIPTHHRLEHWLIHKLIHHRIKHDINEPVSLVIQENEPVPNSDIEKDEIVKEEPGVLIEAKESIDETVVASSEIKDSVS